MSEIDSAAPADLPAAIESACLRLCHAHGRRYTAGVAADLERAAASCTEPSRKASLEQLLAKVRAIDWEPRSERERAP